MVLTEHAEEDEIAVPLCLMIIALATMDVILPGLETPIDLPIIVIRSLPR